MGRGWNSNMFLRLFLNPVILVQSLPIVFKGFLMSLSIVLVAFPLAIPFGFACRSCAYPSRASCVALPASM